MVAELRGGEVVRSWIWQPQHDAAYVAERGLGAWRNGQRLVRPPVGADLRGVTSRRRWIGRALGGLPRAGADLGLLRRGLPQGGRGRGRLRRSTSGPSPGTTPRARCCSRSPAATSARSTGSRYRPQDPPPPGWSRRRTGRPTTCVQGLGSRPVRTVSDRATRERSEQRARRRVDPGRHPGADRVVGRPARLGAREHHVVAGAVDGDVGDVRAERGGPAPDLGRRRARCRCRARPRPSPGAASSGPRRAPAPGSGSARPRCRRAWPSRIARSQPA